jgi:arylsulfatase A-like enzyme
LPVMRHLMSYPYGGWTNFTQAYCNDSICCPSRATLLTGQYSHHHGTISNATKHTAKLDASNTLPVWLNQAGYRTALFGKYLNKITAKQPGWDVWAAGTGGVDATTVKATDFIQAAAVPFFLYVGYNAPHKPARPPARYKTAEVYVPEDSPNYCEADVSDKPAFIRNLAIPSASTQAAWRTERLNAHRELLAVDDGVLAIVEALQAAGQLDNTLLIFVSDNGFSWLNHRWNYKHTAHEESSRVPLLIRYPKNYPDYPENRAETRLVSNVSIASTICEWAGVTPRRPQDAPSLIPLLNGTAVYWPEAVLMEKRGATPNTSHFWGVRVPEFMYAEYNNGDRELYDMAADPWQLENVYGRPEYAAIQIELAARLALLKD